MAKPDDTRITHVPANAGSGNTDNTGTTPSYITPIADSRALVALLEALLETARGKLASSEAAPLPPKSARPGLIKYRRRVTVSASVPPACADAIPWIRLCGHWLTQAGFGLHRRVRVHVVKDCLILIPEHHS